MIAPSVIGWAIETLIASTLLMLLVLVLRKPVRRAFGPNLAYALWLLPVLRMGLPPLPEAWREQAVTPVTAATQVITVYVIDPLSAAAPAAVAAPAGEAVAASGPAIDWMLLLALGWSFGAVLFLGWHLIAHTRFCNRLLARARVDRMIAQGKVRMIETDAAHGPLAFGIWRKYVAFPRDFGERYDELEQKLALAHELGHHARGDLLANWVALVVLAIHWFNPVAWRAFRAFRADQELACDALVLTGRPAALRHAYGRAIVKSAHGGAVSAACHLHTINELKGRLRMLSNHERKPRGRMFAGTVALGALALAGLGLTASGSQAAERIKAKMEDSMGVSLQDLPAPPAPPVSPAEPAPAAAPAPMADPAPNAMPAPPAPPAEPVVVHTKRMVMSADGKKKIVIMHGDGQDFDMDMADLKDIEKSIPEVRSRNCGTDGKDKPMVLNRGGEKPGEKHRIIICTDRIEAVSARAADAQALAMRQKDVAMRGAMIGLQHARASIASNTDMGAERRAEALKGIDEAIAQLEKDGASGD